MEVAKYLLTIKESNIFNCGYGRGYSVQEVIDEGNKLTGNKIKFEYRKNDLPRDLIFLSASFKGNFKNKLHIFYTKRIEDAGVFTNASQVPYRFVPCMTAGLAFYLSQKFAPQRSQEMKLYYEDELARALAEDGSPSSTYITPKTYYPAMT